MIKSCSPKYQPFPELSDDEFESLKQDIKENGLHYPVIQDELGNTLDGHQRERALKALGKKNYPTQVIKGLSEEEKWHFALSTNIKRRHLDNAGKRKLVEQELLRTPDLANNWIAELTGVDVKTVQSCRRNLESTLEIPKLRVLRGKDGKKRSARYSRVLANSERELQATRQIIAEMLPSRSQKILDATTARRRVKKIIRRASGSDVSPLPFTNQDIQLHHCRFQDLAKAAQIRLGSIDLILTDIPYGKDFVPHLSDLGAFAKRFLKDGGLFMTHCGQFHLPEVLNLLGKHLTYRWMMASCWTVEATIVHHLQVASQWKPILIFSKGDWEKRKRWPDVSLVQDKEKSWHSWQQSLVESETLVQRFSNKGDLICDPCGGAFTNAVAALRHGRRFVGCDVDEECVKIGLERLAME
jgi:ParB-like chromosome segregation protein Spo0J